MNKLKIIIPEMEKFFSLDPKKIKEASKEIKESYFETSEISTSFKLKEYDDKKDLDKDFVPNSIRLLVNKHCLIKTDFVYCGAIWHDIGLNLKLGELKKLNKAIDDNESIERIKLINQSIDQLYKRIISIIEKSKEKNSPDLIILPNKILRQFQHQSRNKDSSINILYDDYTSLLINEKKIKLISSKYFKNIIILDSKSISWTYKQDLKTTERIFIDISENKKDLSKVDVIIKTLIKIKITNPNALKIIGFNGLQKD